jgi:signal transduction histidine kinase
MVIAALIDLTERREAEAVLERWAEQLTRSNRDLEEFAYIASHDLKSPLRAMENLASFIMEDAAEKLPEQSRLDLHQIRQRSRRLLALIDGLLQYARIGRDEVVASWVDTGALFTEMGELYLPPERFELVLQSDLPPIFAPRPAVELVFRNLLMNVEKHHDRDRGRVEITGHQEGQAVQFVVADDGPGIPSEHHERVFELFRTLESRDKKEASGLGLTLIKRLLDTHGGTIAIMPSEGRGTSFVVSWPCWQIPSGRGRELADGVAAEPVQAR